MDIHSKNVAVKAASNLPFRWGAQTGTEGQRQNNQNNWRVYPELGLFIVAEGMDDLYSGAQTPNSVMDDLPLLIEAGLRRIRCMSIRNLRKVLEQSLLKYSRGLRGIIAAPRDGLDAAAIAVLLVQGRRGCIGSLGHGRIYRLRKRRLGLLTPDFALTGESDAKMTSSVVPAHTSLAGAASGEGMESGFWPYLRSFEMRAGDIFLLCRDDLTNMIDDRRIARILRDNSDSQWAAQTIVSKAGAAGNPDDVTAMVVAWDG